MLQTKCNKSRADSLYIQEFSSVAQSAPTLCSPMNCSTPGFPDYHQLLELAQTHVPQVGDPSNGLILCYPFSSCLQTFPTSASFLMSQFFASDGQSIGASASVLPMNIQDWFPLELTGLISLVSKGLSRVFSSTTVQKHQFFSTLLFLYGPTLTSVHDY